MPQRKRPIRAVTLGTKVDEPLAEELMMLSKKSGKSRCALIAAAIAEYVAKATLESIAVENQNPRIA
jgi:predicted transcriptional regulator